MAGPKEALGDGCGLEPVGTGREPWLSTPIDRSSSGFGTMNASGRPVFDFDFRTPTGRFDDSLEPKLESGRRSALKVPRVDFEVVSRYSAITMRSRYIRGAVRARYGQITIRTVGSRQVCVVPGNRPGPERARGTRFGPCEDRVVPARKGPGPAVESRSLGTVRPSAAVEALCVAVPNRLVPRAIRTGPTIVDRFVGPRQGTIGLTRLGPLAPGRMLSGWR